MPPKRITAHEIVNHGANHSLYFQGCGVSNTEFEEAHTGVGENAKEAYEDALDQLASAGWDVHHMPTRPHGIRRADAVHHRDHNCGDTCEVHYYVSIRVA